MAIKELKIRTSYPDTISGNPDLIDRIKAADVVHIVEVKTQITLAVVNPNDLLDQVKDAAMRGEDGLFKRRIVVIPFVPGTNYTPPQPKPQVIVRRNGVRL